MKSNRPKSAGAQSGHTDSQLTPTFRCTAPAGNEIVLQASYNLNIKDITLWMLFIVVLICVVFLTIANQPLAGTDVWQSLNSSLEPVNKWNDGYPRSLTDLLIVKLWQNTGYEGVILFHALAVAGIFAALAAAVRSYLGSSGGALVMTLTAAVLIFPSCIVWNSFVMTYLLTAILFLTMVQMRTSAIPVLWIGPLFAAWANLDPRFVLPAFIYAVIQIFANRRRGTGSQNRNIHWLATAAAVLGTIINPHGIFLPTARGTQLIPFVILAGSLLLLLNVILPWVKLRFCTPKEPISATVRKPLSKNISRNETGSDNDDDIDSDNEEAAEEDDYVSPMSVMPFYLFLSFAIVFVTLMWSGPIHGLFFKPRPLEVQVSPKMPLRLAAWLMVNHTSGDFIAPSGWFDFIAFQTKGRMTPMVEADTAEFVIGDNSFVESVLERSGAGTEAVAKTTWKTLYIERASNRPTLYVLQRQAEGRG